VQLLVSVRDAQEASSALAGGADIVDAKDPAAGPLGAVSLETLGAIVGMVGGLRPVTAALGDAAEAAEVERDAAAFIRAGAGLIKIGFARIGDRARVKSLMAGAARGAGADRVIAVAYADYRQAGSLSPLEILDVAADVRVAGILIDTAEKQGPRLCTLVPAAALGRWVTTVRQAGMLAALAGKVAAEDIDELRVTGADIVGVRGAACDGGRDGQVSAERIRLLKNNLPSALRPGRLCRLQIRSQS
jgi:uncharacterized protein (UPF0264 family)